MAVMRDRHKRVIVSLPTRLRDGPLHLENFWKTQLHQNRTPACMTSARVASAFLACENELGRSDEPDLRGMATGSRITRFVVSAIGAILPALQEERPGSAGQTHRPWRQLKTTHKATAKTSNNPGRK
jgi:hypothetical protein